jgi:hypothetical protein
VYRLENGQAALVGNMTQDAELRARLFPRNSQQILADGRPFRQVDPDAVRVGEGAEAKIFPLTYKTGGSNIFNLAEGPNHAVYASTIMPLFLARYTPATDKLENLGRGAGLVTAAALLIFQRRTGRCHHVPLMKTRRVAAVFQVSMQRDVAGARNDRLCRRPATGMAGCVTSAHPRRPSIRPAVERFVRVSPRRRPKPPPAVRATLEIRA